MTHQQVRDLQLELGSLVQYCIHKKVDNFHLSYGLQRNVDRINRAGEAIYKATPKELVSLEEKIYKASEEIKSKSIVDGTSNLPSGTDFFKLGLETLPKEEQEQYNSLLETYKKSMEEEDDFKVYYIDQEKVKDEKIEFIPMGILMKFFKTEEVPVGEHTSKE